MLPHDPPTFATRVPHGYADPERMRADLVAGGLAVDAVETVVLRGQATPASALAEGFCLGTPLRFALAERGDLVALTQAVGDAMAARLGDGPVEGDLTALVVTARAAS